MCLRSWRDHPNHPQTLQAFQGRRDQRDVFRGEVFAKKRSGNLLEGCRTASQAQVLQNGRGARRDFPKTGVSVVMDNTPILPDTEIEARTVQAEL